MKHTLFATMLILLAPTILAGNLFDFQGRVLTTSGSAVANADINVMLYHAATGGTPFYFEFFDNNSNSDGYFSVKIGSMKMLDLNYAQHYFLDFTANDEDFDFGGSERIEFESNRGEIPDSNLSSNVALLNAVQTFLQSIVFSRDANVLGQTNTVDLNIQSGNLKVGTTTYAISDLNRNAQTVCSSDTNSALNSRGQCVSLTGLATLGDDYQNVIIVAKSGGDYNNLTEAVAAARDGNVILVKPGRYTEADTVTISDFNGLSIIGEDIVNTIITHANTDTTTPTIRINDSNNILIKNLHIINPEDVSQQNSNPALQIGPDGNATDNHNIFIEDNFIEGSQYGVVIQGYGAPKTVFPYLPTIWLKGNYIVSGRVALNTRGASQIYSESNFLIVDANLLDNGSEEPVNGRTAGIEFFGLNISDNNHSYFRSSNDVIRVKNLVGSGGGGMNRTIGISITNSSTTAAPNQLNELTFNGANVDVVETTNTSSRTIHGIFFTTQATAVPNFNFIGGRISVKLDNTAASNDVNALGFSNLASGTYNVNIVNTDLNYSTTGTGRAGAITIVNNAATTEIYKFINVTGINNFSTDITDAGNNGTYVLTNNSGQVRTEGYWVKALQGVTSGTYYLCTTSNCSATCRADFNGGILTGCT